MVGRVAGHDDALPGQAEVGGGQEGGAAVQGPQEVAEGGVDEQGAVCGK